MRETITDIINAFFGANAAYFDVDALALAEHLIQNNCLHLEEEIKKDNIITVHSENFTFEYGIVVFKHRFSINRSLNDYEETTLNRCISMSIQHKYYTMACDKLITELQLLYKDENNKVHCLCKDLHDWTFKIKHKGNMSINI
ncbi:MAG: hypothetical protein IKJ07_07865 [Clostridia bacterium]|nr:hypothetical protein [Clostridia bacterium]